MSGSPTYAGERDRVDEDCRHCGSVAAVRIEMGPVSFGLCREHAPAEMLEGQR